MHPNLVQEHQGDCPICGMKLVAIGDAPGAGQPPAKAGAQSALAVTPGQQKILGVVVDAVARSEGAQNLRILGRVAPDESRTYRLNAGIEGSIRDVSSATTGSRVRKDQVLGSYWAPNALSVIQLYILNISGKERLVQRHSEGAVEGEGLALAYVNIQQRLMQLENIGVSALQREELAKTRRVPDTIKMVSPTDGFILARNVTPGLKFERGYEFYRIADLRRVWVVADVFLQDARHVRAGMKAQVSVPEQHVTLPAVVTDVLPQFDPISRTLKIRLEVDNPGYVLRPEMFVDVKLPVALPSAIAIPADAIVDTGTSRTVFVERGEGRFEPREVETGWRDGDRVEIVRGLSPGERIAVSGTFFLDSETRMKAPAPGAVDARTPPPVPTGQDGRSDDGAGPHTQASPAMHGEAAPARAGGLR